MSSDTSYVSDRVAPSVIRYSQMTPLSFSAKTSQKLFFPSNNASYNQDNNIIRIQISSGNSFLNGAESYLKLQFTNKNITAGCTYTASNSWHSLIERVRIIASSGQELENIMNYGQTHAMLCDLLISPEKRMSYLQEGYSQAAQPTFTNCGMAGAGTTAVEVNTALRTLKSDPVTLGCNEMSVAKDGVCQIYLPLSLSQLLGSNKKLIPLFLCGELTLEMTLASKPCIVSVNTTPQLFEVANVAYCASLTEFGGSVNSALTSMVASSGLFLHATCWASQKLTLAPNSSSWINSERLRSVKSIFVTFTDDVSAWGAGKRITSRVTNNLQSFQIKVGSDYLPIQPLRADSTNPYACGVYLNEAYKALGSYQDPNHQGLVNIYNFASDANELTKVGRAVYAVDCDSFGTCDCESGLNTIISNPITFLMEGQTLAVSAISHLLYDCVFELTNTGQFLVSR